MELLLSHWTKCHRAVFEVTRYVIVRVSTPQESQCGRWKLQSHVHPENLLQPTNMKSENMEVQYGMNLCKLYSLFILIYSLDYL